MRKGIIRLLLVPAALCWLGCAAGDKVAGGGSDTPNAPAAFSGEVSIENGGIPDAENVTAVLYRITNDAVGVPVWDTVDQVRTGRDGRFKLESDSSGTYTVVCSKDGYTAFSGYLDIDIPENDSVRIDMDTVVLTRSLRVLGMFSIVNAASRIKVGLVGTGVATDFLTSVTRVFSFENVPLGNYRMRFVLNPEAVDERTMVLPLPTAVGDTSYVETGFGLPTRVAVRNNAIELKNDDIEMTCMVEIGEE